jgi:hypothetical protein
MADGPTPNRCPRCDTAYPEVARFCAACGADVRTAAGGGQRRSVFAAHPGEPLWSFDVVTSLMPLGAGTAPQTYKLALALGLAVPLGAAVFGFLPFALATAALVVPVVYLLYLYDVNQWEDEPVPVVLGTVVFAGVLSVAFTLVWKDAILGGSVRFLARTHGTTLDVKTLLVVGLLVPVVSEVLKEAGPLWLASRDRFDDLIDGLTFGVASGAAYAAAETLVLNRELIFSGVSHYDHANVAAWVSLVVTAGLVKPIVYGSATGIACASYSGLGEGYDGFKPAYFRGLAEAIGANIAFQVGLYLTGLAAGTTGVMLGLGWGLIVAGYLVLRLRFLLHFALLEGALEATRNASTLKSSSRDIGFCPECELPLLDGANFCSACGAAVRAGSKITRRANAAPASEGTAVPS